MSKARLLSTEIFLFLMVQLIGIYVASSLMIRSPELLAVQEISLITFLAIFSMTVILIFLAMKFLKHKFGFKLLFIFLILVGSRTVFASIFSANIATILSFVLMFLWLALPYVFMHNIAIIFAISGISTELGFSVSFTTMVILITLLSIYDVIAVYKTKHMVKMFTSLMNKGLLLSLIIPYELKNWLMPTNKVRPKKGFMLLGTGDLAFPLILAVTALKFSLTTSLFIVGGSTIGSILVFYLLTHQPQVRALPALPPIAICSILGFFVSFLF
jgi:presenilin-like A22 family membrane protease